MLASEAIDLLTDNLVKTFDPEKIILFGSYAWGKPTDESDVDLCVVLKQSSERQIDRVNRARKATIGISYPKDILVKTEAELFRYENIVATLEYKILRSGKILYARTR